MMIVNQQSTLVTTTNQIAVIRVNSLLINPEYLYYFLILQKEMRKFLLYKVED